MLYISRGLGPGPINNQRFLGRLILIKHKGIPRTLRGRGGGREKVMADTLLGLEALQLNLLPFMLEFTAGNLKLKLLEPDLIEVSMILLVSDF